MSKSGRRMRPYLIVMFVAIALFLSGLGAWWYLGGAVQLHVQNWDAQAIRSVVVRVAGKSYKLGDLDQYQTATVRIRAEGKNPAEISFQDGAGKARNLVADCNWGSKGNGGKVWVEVDSQKVRAVSCKVR